MQSNSIRSRVVGELMLLASPALQMQYEQSLKGGGHAPTELINSYCSDIYHPKDPAFVGAFSEDELKRLSHLYGLMLEVASASPATVAEMLKNQNWRAVVTLAKELHVTIQDEA